ncbi:hypothetical protein G6F50_017712 [Rhizopus delemar]|uniref:Uncharacterized protein n=1 Tax=Rhizopus delemar TaxID=936053 RepID=A0A9P6XQA4_9FUNG|nr:hypothetical protein G6F50_017712 [Rhizopus delemar]
MMYAWTRRADPGAALRVPYAASELEALPGGGRVAVSWLRTLLLWLGWCALCVALARPQQLGEAITPPQQGRQMMLAMDVPWIASPQPRRCWQTSSTAVPVIASAC